MRDYNSAGLGHGLRKLISISLSVELVAVFLVEMSKVIFQSTYASISSSSSSLTGLQAGHVCITLLPRRESRDPAISLLSRSAQLKEFPKPNPLTTGASILVDSVQPSSCQWFWLMTPHGAALVPVNPAI